MSKTPETECARLTTKFKEHLHEVVETLNLDIVNDAFTKLLANCIAAKDYCDELHRDRHSLESRLAEANERAERLRVAMNDALYSLSGKAPPEFNSAYAILTNALGEDRTPGGRT